MLVVRCSDSLSRAALVHRVRMFPLFCSDLHTASVVLVLREVLLCFRVASFILSIATLALTFLVSASVATSSSSAVWDVVRW